MIHRKRSPEERKAEQEKIAARQAEDAARFAAFPNCPVCECKTMGLVNEYAYEHLLTDEKPGEQEYKHSYCQAILALAKRVDDLEAKTAENAARIRELESEAGRGRTIVSNEPNQRECPHGKGVYRCDDSDECLAKQVRSSRPNDPPRTTTPGTPGHVEKLYAAAREYARGYEGVGPLWRLGELATALDNAAIEYSRAVLLDAIRPKGQ